MKAYIVGGYVRDRLLGLTPADRDWVVVGETPESMLAQGFKLAGKGFPVFLHPDTGEVYALARTARENGRRHADRTVYSAADVTLEEDLARRDFTINAMAIGPEGALIDPFGGEADLKAGTLRHVGPGFVEDPLRVLRMARFAARFGFSPAQETLAVVGTLVRHGAMDSLVAERVWAELVKALSEDHCEVFFSSLHRWGVLSHVFPEIDRMFPGRVMADGNANCAKTQCFLDSLRAIAGLSDDVLVRFGVVVRGFSVVEVESFCERWAAPVRYRRFGIACARFCSAVQGAFGLDAPRVVGLFEGVGAFKRPEDMERLVLVCQADAQGQNQPDGRSYPQADYLGRLLRVASDVSSDSVFQSGVTGEEFGRSLRTLRIQAVEEAIGSYGRATE
jgi:tRNA nucleotidyltransferase (CCA-adding enzyme)